MLFKFSATAIALFAVLAVVAATPVQLEAGLPDLENRGYVGHQAFKESPKYSS